MARRGPERPLGGPVRLPPHAPGLAIGLFGGSFDPPHAAHRDVCLLAMKRLGLDRVWWLVTPGNPLKPANGRPALAERLAAARRLAHHPRIDVTGLEADIGTRYSVDTLAYLKRRCRGVRFVWIMGADNLAQFHHWKDWPGIARAVPIAVVDRGGGGRTPMFARAAVALSGRRINEADAVLRPGLRPPAWVFLHGLKSPLSSTAIRNRTDAPVARGMVRVENVNKRCLS